MSDIKNQPQISPDAMSDPARKDGGGQDAASALAFQIVQNAMIDEDMARRLRQAFDGDTEPCVALKLGLSNTTVRQACRSGRPSARILRRVCVVYGVEGTWLLTGEGPRKRAAAVPDGAPSEQLLQEVSLRLGKMLATIESARAPSARKKKLPPEQDSAPRANESHWL